MTAASAASGASAASAGGPRPASAGLRRVHAQILRQLALMAELARGPEAELAARALAPRLGELEAGGGRSRHPLFGGLGGRQWLRFVTVHHHHHLKIVRDIRRARGLATAGLPSR